MAWGDAEAQTKLDGVAKSILQNGNHDVTAALKTDSSVVAWGRSTRGGDASKVQHQLVDVRYIYASRYAFAALKADGSIVSWGRDSDQQAARQKATAHQYGYPSLPEEMRA